VLFYVVWNQPHLELLSGGWFLNSEEVKKMSPKMVVETIQRDGGNSIIVESFERGFCTIIDESIIYSGILTETAIDYRKKFMAAIHNGLVTTLILAGYRIEGRLFDAEEERFPVRTTLVI